MERAIMCPQCNAPLAPSRFARSVVCSYCGTTVQLGEATVSAARFHEAFRAWNSPSSYNIPSWISFGESHWALNEQIAQGGISDVYAGQRARRPTELVIVKVLRDQKDTPPFENEWDTVQTLHRSEAPGADTFSALLPQPVLRGAITAGALAGRHAKIFRWTSGFHHTFEDVLQTYPQGIPPRASIWIWRRMLEVLSFLHNSRTAHGGILPPHLLIQENEHGVLLVGYGSAGPIGEPLRNVDSRYVSFYPGTSRSSPNLSPQLDIVMSARLIIALLGGDPATGSIPSTVPGPLAEYVKRFAEKIPSGVNAWSIREELGDLAGKVFGPPQFIPIVMPS